MKTTAIILVSLFILFWVAVWYFARVYFRKVREQFKWITHNVRVCRKCGAEQMLVYRGKKDAGTWVHGKNTKNATDKDCSCLKYIN